VHKKSGYFSAKRMFRRVPGLQLTAQSQAWQKKRHRVWHKMCIHPSRK
jgi:hypothetical protein